MLNVYTRRFATVFLSVILLSATMACSDDDDANNSQENEPVSLQGKWDGKFFVEEFYSGNVTITNEGTLNNVTLEFQSDNNFSRHEGGSLTSSGSYSFEHDTLLTLNQGEASERIYTVEELSRTELVISASFQDTIQGAYGDVELEESFRRDE